MNIKINIKSLTLPQLANIPDIILNPGSILINVLLHLSSKPINPIIIPKWDSIPLYIHTIPSYFFIIDV